MRSLSVDDRSFHVDCFRCEICQKQILEYVVDMVVFLMCCDGGDCC